MWSFRADLPLSFRFCCSDPRTKRVLSKGEDVSDFRAKGFNARKIGGTLLPGATRQSHLQPKIVNNVVMLLPFAETITSTAPA